MKPGKIVVFGTSFLDELPTDPPGKGEADAILSTLKADSGGALEVEYRTERDPADPLTPEELSGARAVIADLERYDGELLMAVGPRGGGELELIARYGVGYDSIDLDAATEAGVLVANAPGANTLPTAEWSVSTLLDIAGRRLDHHRRAAAGRAKEGPSRLDVCGRTLGLLGTGSVGRWVVELMRGFEMRILAHDPYPREEWAREKGVAYVDLVTLLKESDFVSLHAASNKQLIGPEQLSLMKKNAVLVNCARGVLVDNPAAYRAVAEGRLFGYGLDEVWRYPELPLEGLNIAVSPHVGSDTDLGKANMQRFSAQAVLEYFSGNLPTNTLNPSAYRRQA